MKRAHPLKIVRIVISTAVLAGFVLLFLSMFPPAQSILLVLTRLQFLPSVIALVLSGVGRLASAWIVILGITMLFGRVYCSTLCPLGAFQDAVRILSRAFRPKRSLRSARSAAYRPVRALKGIRYAVLGITVVSIVAGSMAVVDLLGPYRFFGMIAKDVGVPIIALASHGVFNLLKPFGIFISPLVVPVDGIVFIIGVLMTLALITSVVINGRLFCNSFCPVGALLSIPASRSLFSITIDEDACTACGACERVCKAGCIRSAAKTVDTGRCVSCFNCLSVCPVDAIGYTARTRTNAGSAGTAPANTSPATRGPDSSIDSIPNPGRRMFLNRIKRGISGSLVIFPLSFLIRRRARTPDGGKQTPASPPGSRSVTRFSERCIACHLCVTRCPTGVLQPSLFEYGITGIMQPTMDFSLGFCEYECNVCSQVCPTGAISLVSLAEKKLIQIGSVHFSRERCVVVTNGTACGACAEVCPTNATRMVPFDQKGSDSGDWLLIPETETAHCIGCGNCEYACPVLPDKAIYVIGKKVHEVAQMPRSEFPEDDRRTTGGSGTDSAANRRNGNDGTDRTPDTTDTNKNEFPF